MAIVGFVQLCLPVRDLERSRRFYREALGCEVGAVRTFEDPAASPGGPARARAAVVERGGLRIELLESASAAPPSQDGAYLVFAVDDLDATLQSLRDRGVEVLDATRRCFAPGVATCLVRDPDGRPIQLYQVPAGADAGI